MTPAFSVFLELARVIATLMVFVSHSSEYYEPFARVAPSYSFGRDGVLIFFILSGFVISWCAREREHSFGNFVINRASRIYSVAIPGLVLGAAASLALTASQGSPPEYQFNAPWLYLPIYLSFTGSFWTLSETPPGNMPYWSLNYEVWYYLIFAAFFFVRGRLRWLAAAGLIVLVGPNLTLMLPLWAAGSVFYFNAHRISLSPRPARWLLAASVVAYLWCKLTHLDNLADSANDLLFRHWLGLDVTRKSFLGDYLLAVFVLASFVFARYARLEFSDRFVRTVRELASYSFSFYLFHVPVFTAIDAAFGLHGNTSLTAYLLTVATAIAVIVLLARYTEHRKELYRRLFTALVGRWRRAARSHRSGAE